MATLPFDFKRQRWAATWDRKWQALPGRREQLPALVSVGSIIGGITREAADATGLGAAIAGVVSLGLPPGFATAVQAMTRRGRVFEPDRSPAAMYEALYRQNCCQGYGRLGPLYTQRQKILG